MVRSRSFSVTGPPKGGRMLHFLFTRCQLGPASPSGGFGVIVFVPAGPRIWGKPCVSVLAQLPSPTALDFSSIATVSFG